MADKTMMLSTLKQKIDSEVQSKDGNQPLAGTVSDGNFDFTRSKLVGEDGRVKTMPRQIYGGRCRSGRLASSFITKPTFISVGDPYKDQGMVDKQYLNSRKKKLPHEQAFKPSSGTKSDPINTIFKWQPLGEGKKTKNHRNADGKVEIGPRQIVTSPAKEGHLNSTIGHLFSKPWKHMPDEYDRKRQLQLKYNQEARSKLQKEPFKATDYGNKSFNSDKKVFGLDKPLPPKRERPQSYTPGYKHEAAFRPNNPGKHGYNGTFSKFPEYKPNPVHIAVRRKTEEGEAKKDAFK